MNNVKKDIAILYMLRNFLGTFLVVFLAFFIALMQYYHCSTMEVLNRIFINNIFTISYFLLLWVFDYLVFEVSKIIYDTYNHLLNNKIIMIIIIISFLSLLLPLSSVMKYNLFLLLILITIRIIKQELKKSGLTVKKSQK